MPTRLLPLKAALLWFFIVFSVGSSANHVSAQGSENPSKYQFPSFASEKILVDKGRVSGCARSLDGAPQSYTLVGSYYTLKNGYDTILMFNNKGPEPLAVSPVFFNLDGERLELEDFVIPAKSYQEVKLEKLLANHFLRFREGSLQVTHSGGRLQLGAQFKIEKGGVLFDEQFITPASRFPSQKMESVWWVPSPKVQTNFVISNTSDSPVTANVRIDGTVPQQPWPAVMDLKPHETKILDVMRDLVGRRGGGTILENGGISINHNGAAGALIARMLVSDDETGYSSIVGFVDPTTAGSSKLNGAGLRVGKIGTDKLEPVLAVRNISSEPSVIKVKIPYTDVSGEVEYAIEPDIELLPLRSKTIRLWEILERANLPDSVAYTGLEVEYTTAPGTVVMNAQSVSKSGKQVFQLPLLDPLKLPSSAGGFPWKTDDNYTTIVYIKNESDLEREYIAKLTFDGGDYVLRVEKLKPGQTVAVDFKEFRDKQVPDVMGRLIPLEVTQGQASWSMRRGPNKGMTGRSEQVNIKKGVSSTYACYNCCPDSQWNTGTTFPEFVNTETGGEQLYLVAVDTTNCYGQPSSTSLPGYNFVSSNVPVATVTYEGDGLAVSPGGSTFTGKVYLERWDFDGRDCYGSNSEEDASGTMQVDPTVNDVTAKRSNENNSGHRER
jgi:hypothetical protein